jgi:alpha-amylase
MVRRRRFRWVTTMLAVALAVEVMTPGVSVAKPPKRPAEKPQTAAAPQWFDGRIFYEIFVRSFYDSNGDGIGDLDGVRQRLDHLSELGVGGIWLMPIMPSDAYHGYATTDYREVETDYGSLADLKALIAEARARDIRVIIDLVINHTSKQHPWFQEALKGGDKRAWYIFRPDDPGTRGPWGQKVWHPAGDGTFYFGLFDASQPDLNLKNSAVTAELNSVSQFWTKEVGVDGFRLDAAKHLIEVGTQAENTPETIAWWTPFNRQLPPDTFTVGEILSSSTSAAQYVPNGMDSSFDIDLEKAIIKAARDGNSADVSVETNIAVNKWAGNRASVYLTNHDETRIWNQVSEDVTKAKLAASILLTSPGIVYEYYGEEVGMSGTKPDERIRTPMPWDSSASAGFTTSTPWQPLSEGTTTRNVATMNADPTSLLNHYRTLGKLRKSVAALNSGSYIPVSSPGPTYAYLRISGKQTVLVVHNVGAAPLTDLSLSVIGSGLPTTMTPRVLFGAASGTSVAAPKVVKGGFSRYTPMPLGPCETLIIELTQ